MAMATGSAGASALIMALNSAKTVKSTKALFDTTKELNKAQESGALDTLNQVFQGIMNTGPIQSAFSVLFAQIQAGTTAATVGLMTELLSLFASEAGQTGLKLLIDTLSLIVNTTADLVKLANNLLDVSGAIDEFEAARRMTEAMRHNLEQGYVEQDTYRPGFQEYG